MDPNPAQFGTLNESTIRSVFRDWDSLAALGSHPLANLGIVEHCRQEARYTPTPAGRGLALRKVIQSAVDTLKPAGDSPELDEKNWRRFTILQEQYINARSPEWVAQQLNISKATYYAEQKRALQILADILCKWEEEQPQPLASEGLALPVQPQPPPMAVAAAAAVADAPFMAPARPPHPLVGRDRLLRDLVRGLKSGANRRATVLVGLPGVGKTRTAVELAHHPEILEHFRDGILWSTLGRQPDIAALLDRWAAAVGMQPEAAAQYSLYGLGGEGASITANRPRYGMAGTNDPHVSQTIQDPPGTLPSNVIAGPRTPYGSYSVQSHVAADQTHYVVGRYTDVIAERAVALHTAIGMRRMLLIIDDAWQVEAALAFKVGGPNCAYLLTTRLVNIALDFAPDQVITLHELGDADGLNLLTQMAPPVVEADPDAARSLVQLAGGLPLALVLIGQHLQKQSYHHQPRRMRDALAELQAARTRLELAQPQPVLEQRTDLPPNTPLTLQTSIGMSDAALEYAAHRALVALALFPPKPNAFSEEAALAVIQAPIQVLDSLLDCGLVESTVQHRYTLHRAIADYAALEAADPDATQRMVAYFAGYAGQHASDERALELELENLLTAAEIAFNAHLCAPVIQLAHALYPFLASRGLYPRAAHLLIQANRAAALTGNSNSQAACLCRLSEIALRQGAADQARAYLEQALATARAAGLDHLEQEALQKIQALGEG